MYHPEMFTKVDISNSSEKEQGSAWIKNSCQEEKLLFPTEEIIFNTGYKRKLLTPECNHRLNHGMAWTGSDLNDHLIPAACQDRDTFH